MSKSFREGYEDSNWAKEKRGKSHKQNRKTVKEYLRQIDEEEDYNEAEDYWDDVDIKLNELD